MSNNFYLNNDPLLYQQAPYRSADNEEDIRMQFAELMSKYANSQGTQQQNRDYLSELDTTMKGLTKAAAESLEGNEEFMTLKSGLSEIIQSEIMRSIKDKINRNTTAIKNMERQMEIIRDTTKATEAEQQKNLNDINEYLKSYSHMTFDDYKKMKASPNIKPGKNNNVK